MAPLTNIENRFAALDATQRVVAHEVTLLAEALTDVNALRLAERRNRHWLRVLSFVSIVLVLIASLAILWRVNTLLDKQARAITVTCVQRNESTAAVRSRMAQLASAEKDPTLRQVWLTLSHELGRTPTACDVIANAN